MIEPIIFIFAAILIFGALLMWLIGRGTRSKKLDQEKYRCKWLEIEHILSKTNETTYTMCILRADSLLDEALKDRGTSGSTMGERLKSASKKFTNLNAVWAAHKIRNRLAHESDFSVSYDTTRQALAAFKKGLKDLGAI